MAQLRHIITPPEGVIMVGKVEAPANNNTELEKVVWETLSVRYSHPTMPVMVAKVERAVPLCEKGGVPFIYRRIKFRLGRYTNGATEKELEQMVRAQVGGGRCECSRCHKLYTVPDSEVDRVITLLKEKKKQLMIAQDQAAAATQQSESGPGAITIISVISE